MVRPWMSARDFTFFLDIARYKIATIGLEWGGGESTAAFAKEFCDWTVIEHNPEWIEHIRKTVRPRDLSKLHIIQAEDDEEKYANVPLNDTRYDFIFVDGRYRGKCAERILRENLAPLVVIHDMQRNESGSQHALRKFPVFGKVADDCGIGMMAPPIGALRVLLEKYDYRDLMAPSIPWHPSHEDLLYRDWCGLRACYNLDS